MKKFIFFTFIIISLFWVNACIEEMPIIGNIEILTTKVVPHTLSVTVSGKIVVPPERTVLERGIAYGGSPHNLSSHIVLSQTINAGFTQSVNNLKAGTTYYFATYAKLKGNKIIYGKVLNCTTMAGKVPTVQTVAFSNVTATSFDCGGVVLSKGESSIIRQGIIYGTIEIPTDTLFYVDLTQDKFTLTIPKLTQGITYYYRAFARNKGGIALGDIYTYRLGAVLTTTAVTAITATTATLGGNITDDGSVPITERGICYATTPIPTISNHKVESGSGKGSFSVDLSSLSANTFYYCRSYAVNKIGTYYGNEISFKTLSGIITLTTTAVTAITTTTATLGGNITDDGSSPITERGICYATTPIPTISTHKVESGSGKGSFSVDLSSLSANTTYYCRSYAINKIGTYYGNEISFKTLSGIITLTTTAVTVTTATTATTATLGGNITDDGSVPITERGICYATTPIPTISNHKVESGSGKGSYSVDISSLSANTFYYCRSYAINNIGIYYGNEIVFITFTNFGIPFEMIPVAGGTFTMGSPTTETNRSDDETQHPVTLSSYQIGKYEVTQAQWKAVMGGENPSRFKDDNLPVEQVSWDDIQVFIQKLNILTGKNYRLPTEAEWEYAARGGNQSKGYLVYSGSNNLDEVGWHYYNSGNRTHVVGTKRPNELGIYDMSGNVEEWCSDWYNSAYPTTLQTDPTGPATGTYRVFRGGSWNYYARYCRSAYRSSNYPSSRYIHLGFRLVLRP